MVQKKGHPEITTPFIRVLRPSQHPQKAHLLGALLALNLILSSHFWIIALSLQTVSLILAPELSSLGNWGGVGIWKRERKKNRERRRERERVITFEEVRQCYNQALTQVMEKLLLGHLGSRKEERDFPESFLIFYLSFTLFLGPLGSLPAPTRRTD